MIIPSPFMKVFVNYEGNLAEIETKKLKYVDNMISQIRICKTLCLPDKCGYIWLESDRDALIPGNMEIKRFHKVYRLNGKRPFVVRCLMKSSSLVHVEKTEPAPKFSRSIVVVVPRESIEDTRFFRLRSENGIKSQDRMIFLRPEVFDLFNFIKTRVFVENKVGWITGSSGCGKTSAVMAYIALDRSLTAVYTLINLIPEGAQIFRFKAGKRQDLKILRSDIGTAILELLQNESCKNNQTHCVIFDDFLQGEDYSNVEGALLTWHESSKTASTRRLLFITSLANRSKHNFSSYIEFFMLSWTYQQYRDAITNQKLFDSIKNMLDANLRYSETKDELLHAKFFFAGGNIRFMFEYNTDMVIKEIILSVKNTPDAFEYLSGRVGFRGSGTISNLFVVLEDEMSQKLGRFSRRTWPVSRFASCEIAVHAQTDDVECILSYSDIKTTPAKDDYSQEILFFSRMSSAGLQGVRQNMKPCKFVLLNPNKIEFELSGLEKLKSLWLRPTRWCPGLFSTVLISLNIIRFVQFHSSGADSINFDVIADFVNAIADKDIFRNQITVEVIRIDRKTQIPKKLTYLVLGGKLAAFS
jgi:hypothetical protein